MMIYTLLFDMPDWGSSGVWMSLLTLTFLEIVLGVDNIIFITLAADKLPKELRKKATNIGLFLAMFLRIALLFGISWLISMQEPWLSLDWGWLHAGFSGQSFILIFGGIFLLYKGKKGGVTMTSAIIQITLINIVFSFDSILTAVGMTNGLYGALVIMVISVVLSVGIMLAFANPVGEFVNKHPTIQMLGLAFLILIGFMLIIEGGHLAHLTIFESEIGAVPKGYLYFAIAFSMVVEFLNMKLRKGNAPVQLHNAKEKAKKAQA